MLLVVYANVQDATVLDLYREVESRLPNKDIRLSIGDTELRKEVHGAHLLNQHAKHTSSVVVLWRSKGGIDYNQIQMRIMLLLCDEGMWSCNVGMDTPT